MPIRKILVASDLSDSADVAILLADRWARAHDAALTTVHVMPSMARSDPLFPELNRALSQDVQSLERRAGDLLRERVRALTGRGADHLETVITDGAAHARIVELAEERGVDLVVVGSRGGGGLRRILLGTTADKVVRHAHCTVLVARPGEHTGKLLAATDFSPGAEKAVREAAALAARASERLAVVHVFDLPVPLAGAGVVAGGDLVYGLPPEAIAAAEERARARLAEHLVALGVEADARVCDPPAAVAILRVAEELPAELVVVGTVGRTGLRRLLLGSVAETVAQAAHCSVLVVR